MPYSGLAVLYQSFDVYFVFLKISSAEVLVVCLLSSFQLSALSFNRMYLKQKLNQGYCYYKVYLAKFFWKSTIWLMSHLIRSSLNFLNATPILQALEQKCNLWHLLLLLLLLLFWTRLFLWNIKKRTLFVIQSSFQTVFNFLTWKKMYFGVNEPESLWELNWSKQVISIYTYQIFHKQPYLG